VVYLREGHEAHVASSHNKLAKRPWEALEAAAAAKGGALRPAEPCTIFAIRYEVTGGWRGRRAQNVGAGRVSLAAPHGKPPEGPAPVPAARPSPPADERTVAVLGLWLCDHACPIFGTPFEVEAPPPGSPEFVVLRSRYDAAVGRPWALGERVRVRARRRQLGRGKAGGRVGGGARGLGARGSTPQGRACLKACSHPPPQTQPHAHPTRRSPPPPNPPPPKLFMSEDPGAAPDPDAPPDPSAGAEPSGRWWDAQLVADARPPAASPGDDPVTNPYGAGGLWERYRVKYLLDEPPPDGADVTQDVSPWEMFPDGTMTDAALAEEPCRVPPPDAARLVAALRAARRSGRWRLFAHAPGPEDAWEDKDGALQPYNRVVALPMGLDILQVGGPDWQVGRVGGGLGGGSGARAGQPGMLQRARGGAVPRHAAAVPGVSAAPFTSQPISTLLPYRPSSHPPPQERLARGYYRSLEAFKQDALLITINAESKGVGG
jgi:hypothetical protein